MRRTFASPQRRRSRDHRAALPTPDRDQPRDGLGGPSEARNRWTLSRSVRRAQASADAPSSTLVDATYPRAQQDDECAPVAPSSSHAWLPKPEGAPTAGDPLSSVQGSMHGRSPCVTHSSRPPTCLDPHPSRTPNAIGPCDRCGVPRAARELPLPYPTTDDSHQSSIPDTSHPSSRTTDAPTNSQVELSADRVRHERRRASPSDLVRAGLVVTDDSDPFDVATAAPLLAARHDTTASRRASHQRRRRPHAARDTD